MPPPDADTPPSDVALASARLPLWRKVFPFALAIALVAAITWRLDFALFLRQLQLVDYRAIFALAVGFTFSLLAADTLATVGIYRRTVCPISFRELFVLRAASYLPSLLNHHVGQVWLTYFLAKVYGAPLWRVAGATLLTYATTLGCLLLFGLLAIPFNAHPFAWLLPVLISVLVLAFAYLGVIAAKPRFLRGWQTTAPLVEVGVRGHLVAFVLRIPHMLVLFAGTWLSLWLFQIRIPIGHALATVPLLMVVAGLPLTPQGVGTRDVLAVQLFSQFGMGTVEARHAAIVAATLSWAFALTLVQLCISFVFMRKARRLMAGGTPESAKTPAPSAIAG